MTAPTRIKLCRSCGQVDGPLRITCDQCGEPYSAVTVCDACNALVDDEDQACRACGWVVPRG